MHIKTGLYFPVAIGDGEYAERLNHLEDRRKVKLLAAQKRLEFRLAAVQADFEAQISELPSETPSSKGVSQIWNYI